jgi:hypothetical protein
MVPQLSRVTDPFGITVMSSGGFESVTEKHNFAAELASEDRPTEVLHIGDHDPSGAHMFLAFLEDVEAFTRDLGGTDCRRHRQSRLTTARFAARPAKPRR